MLNNKKEKKLNLLSRWATKHRGLSSLVAVGVLWSGINFGINTMVNAFYDMNIYQAQSIAGRYNDNNLNNLLKSDPITHEVSAFDFNAVPFYQANHLLKSLEYIKNTSSQKLDLTNEAQTLKDIDNAKIDYSIKKDIKTYYLKTNREQLIHAFNAYENILNFNNLIHHSLPNKNNVNMPAVNSSSEKKANNTNTVSNTNSTNNTNTSTSSLTPKEIITPNTNDKVKITESDKTEYMENIKTLNQYNQEFIKLDYQLTKEDLFSFHFETKYFLIALAFSLIFWASLVPYDDKNTQQRKITLFIYRKLDRKSRKELSRLHKEIKEKTHLPKTIFSKEKITHMLNVFKQNGINLNELTMKKDNIKMDNLEKSYFFLFPAIILTSFFTTFDVTTNILSMFIAFCVVLIKNTAIHDEQHIKKYILNNYASLSKDYPEEILKLFLEEPSQEMIQLAENHIKQNINIDLFGVFEKFKREQLKNHQEPIISSSIHAHPVEEVMPNKKVLKNVA